LNAQIENLSMVTKLKEKEEALEEMNSQKEYLFQLVKENRKLKTQITTLEEAQETTVQEVCLIV
jgi:hypothetical protein